MWNVKFKTLFYFLFIQTSKNVQTKTKLLLKFIKFFNLPVER